MFTVIWKQQSDELPLQSAEETHRNGSWKYDIAMPDSDARGDAHRPVYDRGYLDGSRFNRQLNQPEWRFTQ